MAEIKFAFEVVCINEDCKKKFFALYETNLQNNTCPHCLKTYILEVNEFVADAYKLVAIDENVFEVSLKPI